MPRRAEPKATEKNGSLRVCWQGQEHYCGPWDDPASWRRFEELKEDLLNGGPGSLSMAGLIDRYTDHAAEYYRLPDGTPTREVDSINRVLKKLARHYLHHRANFFGPSELIAFRKTQIDAKRCREQINKDMGRIVRMFKFGVEHDLVEAEAWHKLRAVAALQAGRSPAPDMPDVEPVAWDVVDATLPFLDQVLQGAVWMQRLSGCRPDEALRLRMVDVDRSDLVWIYSPTCPKTGKPRHKTAHKGKPCYRAIPPLLQQILRPLIEGLDPEAYVFSPARATALRRARRRALRKTRVQPSQLDRSKSNPRKRPGLRYSVRSYWRALQVAADKADAAAKQKLVDAGQEIPAGRLVPRWAPNRIRHSVADDVERTQGLFAAQKLLGHEKPDTTRIYLSADVERIKQIALERAPLVGPAEVQAPAPRGRLLLRD